MKADIEICQGEVGWVLRPCGYSYMNETVEEKACIRDQTIAIILGWGMDVEL